jgi:lipoate-protein ligase A
VPFEVSAAGEQAWNQAALAGRPVSACARIWVWPAPGIVLGRAQSKRLEAVRSAAGRGIEVIARGSGGGAVLTGPWMVGASVVLPPGHPLLGKTLTDAYRWLGEAYQRALSGFGVIADLLPPDRVARVDAAVAGGPVPWACFGGLSPWELVDADGRKLVGLAQQRRRDGVLLVSGALVRTPPWSLLCHAMHAGQDEIRLAARTTSIEALCTRPLETNTTQQVALALEAQVTQALGAP